MCCCCTSLGMARKYPAHILALPSVLRRHPYCLLSACCSWTMGMHASAGPLQTVHCSLAERYRAVLRGHQRFVIGGNHPCARSATRRHPAYHRSTTAGLILRTTLALNWRASRANVLCRKEPGRCFLHVAFPACHSVTMQQASGRRSFDFRGSHAGDTSCLALDDGTSGRCGISEMRQREVTLCLPARNSRQQSHSHRHPQPCFGVLPEEDSFRTKLPQNVRVSHYA
jgi:hypothetical protein